MENNQIKASSIAVTALTDADYVELMTKTIAVIDEFDAATLQVKVLYDEIKPLMSQAEQALVAVRGNSKTKLLVAADKVRDRLLVGLNHNIKSFEYDSDADNAEASIQLQRIIKLYGKDIKRKPYNEETALVRSMVTDLTNETNLPLLTKIGADSWTTKLTTANQEFDTLMKSRLEEDADALGFTVRDVRKSIDPIFHDIIQAVETFTRLKVTGPFPEALTKLNAVIDYYN